MLNFWKALVGLDKRDLEPKQSDTDRTARKLEMDEPMAGAGALLAGEHSQSESR